jgi:hypothetical protein
VAEERQVHEVLLDCLVYAPVGAAIVALEEVPRLAELGRERVEKQLALARLLGKFAVGEGRRRFGAAPSPGRPATGRGEADGDVSPRAATARHVRASAEDSGPAAGQDGALSDEATTDGSEPSGAVSGGPSRDLPIPAYDTLAASQVVERLASLTPAELEAVRKHEAATRRRRTVLHKIAQLSSESGGATA